MPINATQKYWVLETKNTAYSFGLSENGLLAHTYWGKKLTEISDYPAVSVPGPFSSTDGYDHFIPEEYPAEAGIKYIESCLRGLFYDGVRDIVLVYQNYTLETGIIPSLTIHLRDAYYPLSIDLVYELIEEHDLISRKVILHNIGTEPVQFEKIASAKLTIPPRDKYHFTHMYGRHLDEFNIATDTLSPGLKVIESRRGIPSHRAVPWFAVHTEATEIAGDVWFGTLSWSGNHKITAELTEFGSARVILGINDWDFAWLLKPNEKFVTPEVIFGYSDTGFGKASRNLHNYVRDYLLPHKTQIHKILYNSWEATTFNVDEQSQITLAEIASKMGIELFVMDDGWFHNRNIDNAGLGDWWPDKNKFPNGLGGLIHKVNQLGMDFGLWIEPEMVNPDSELYREHPDWVIHFPTRKRNESRNQLVLNMAKTEVQDYLLSSLDELLSKNNIAFIKWDMNRSISEAGWQEPIGDARELWVRYVYGLYRVWGELRKRHPKVIWQSCASGGGRPDYGILNYADQVWISDNTEAASRLRIQEGYSLLSPAITMEAWVTDWNEGIVPLEFRFHVSMCGTLGVGGNLLDWDDADRKIASDSIQKYKEIREIIQLGDQYRLRSAQKTDYSAVQYLSKEKSQGVLFVFRTHIPERFNIPQLYLQGLEPNALYKVEGFTDPKTGQYWMSVGINLPLKNFQSRVLTINKVV